MHWNSITKTPEKKCSNSLESVMLMMARFVGDTLMRLDEGYYNYPQKRYYYESDRFSDEHAITVNSTHWMYFSDYVELLEGLPKDK